MDKITITVNGKDFQVDPGQTVLAACLSLGIDIPRLCWHPRTRVYGGCRLCIVEIEGLRGLPISCGTDVTDGMKIKTETPQIESVRRMIVELLIASGDHNCMVCEKNGSCSVQALAYRYGIDKPRFALRGEPVPIDDSNPFIIRDYNKCVLCGRCSRVCNEVVGQGAINLAHRGINARISTAGMCGSCVQACPTGALAYKKARFQGRPTETEPVVSTCPYCGCGCQLVLHVKDGKVVYVEGDESQGPNYGTTCLKGRFGFDYISSPDRLRLPLVRQGQDYVETSWNEALELVARRLKEIRDQSGPDSIFFASSAKATNEENYAAMKFTRAVLQTNNIDHCARL
jgi:predicted molibdopterin-dependent oxidoreductase YjgC